MQKYNTHVFSIKRVKFYNKIKKTFMTYLLQSFISASVLHSQKCGESNSTTRLLLIQERGY